jgi:hypothetical protein
MKMQNRVIRRLRRFTQIMEASALTVLSPDSGDTAFNHGGLKICGNLRNLRKGMGF